MENRCVGFNITLLLLCGSSFFSCCGSFCPRWAEKGEFGVFDLWHTQRSHVPRGPELTQDQVLVQQLQPSVTYSVHKFFPVLYVNIRWWWCLKREMSVVQTVLTFLSDTYKLAFTSFLHFLWGRNEIHRWSRPFSSADFWQDELFFLLFGEVFVWMKLAHKTEQNRPPHWDLRVNYVNDQMLGCSSAGGVHQVQTSSRFVPLS